MSTFPVESVERQLERIGECRDLLLLLPDQLDRELPGRLDLERDADVVVQLEIGDDFRHVPSHRQRTALFLAAMRHSHLELEAGGWRALYRRLGDDTLSGSLSRQLKELCVRMSPRSVEFVRPGSWRTLRELESLRASAGCRFEMVENPHFLCQPDEFATWAEGRSRLVMEHFYRWMRRRLGILVDGDGQPTGGQWNFDRENRQPLPSAGLELPKPRTRASDALLEEVLGEVEDRLADAPGELDEFIWPVTREQALQDLDEFVSRRLPQFGPYQDAMKVDQGWLFHSWLSPALNLGLLDPRECLNAALAAHEAGSAPLASVEGFVRQILGWREFIRGVYWLEGPDYGRKNELQHREPLPSFYWTGETEMRCVRSAVGQVLRHGYGHHIERLMVTGNLALLAGIDPLEVNDWYLGMYVDSMDWVTAPNTLGMSQYADGGVVGTKPYVSSGRYIDRMSDFCDDCDYDPSERVGDSACPFTTFYWEFLDRHSERLKAVPRMGFALRNLDRLSAEERSAIAARARAIRRSW